MIKQNMFKPIQGADLPDSVIALYEKGKNRDVSDRYTAGKIAQTYETLQSEMGIGKNAYRLPAPHDYEPGEDGEYAYRKWLNDNGS